MLVLPLFLLAALVAGQSTPPAPADDDDDYYKADPVHCAGSRPYLVKVNRLAIAICAVGAVGVALCLLSVLHVIGHNRDKRSLAARLVLGMLIGNLIYAVIDTTPIHLRRLSGDLCADRTIGPRHRDTTARCLPTAVMFAGVWITTMYELMMVLVSTYALKTGRGSIPLNHERALHLASIGAGVAALLGFHLRCRVRQSLAYGGGKIVLPFYLGFGAFGPLTVSSPHTPCCTICNNLFGGVPGVWTQFATRCAAPVPVPVWGADYRCLQSDVMNHVLHVDVFRTSTSSSNPSLRLPATRATSRLPSTSAGRCAQRRARPSRACCGAGRWGPSFWRCCAGSVSGCCTVPCCGRSATLLLASGSSSRATCWPRPGSIRAPTPEPGYSI